MTKGSGGGCRYPKVAQIEAFAAAAPPGEQRPGILCEYAHSMGNSTGVLPVPTARTGRTVAWFDGRRRRKRHGSVAACRLQPTERDTRDCRLRTVIGHAGNFREYWDCFERLEFTQARLVPPFPLLPLETPGKLAKGQPQHEYDRSVLGVISCRATLQACIQHLLGSLASPGADLLCSPNNNTQAVFTPPPAHQSRTLLLPQPLSVSGSPSLAAEAALVRPMAQGGFIWDWVDQGLIASAPGPDSRPAVFWGYGGDFGDPCHDAQFCINGLVWPDRTPHPACWEVKAVQARLTALVPPSPARCSRLDLVQLGTL